MVVYINTQGARLVKEGRHLLVKKGEATYHTLFTYKLKQIVIFGNVDSVRGYEGRASALYFEAFASGFIEKQNFTRRIRRPPTDPVNSILSLLYTFLMNRVYAAVRVAGLDPYPGFLHSIDYGRYSLVLDLMEELRTPRLFRCST